MALFENLKKSRDLTSYNLMAGTTDFGNLVQFNMYESGYAALFVVKIPTFLEKLAARKEYADTYKPLIDNYKHILEREFKNLDGLEDISTETQTITDGINEMNVITQTKMQGGSSFSMTYQEKSGSPITRLHELYLRGIRDPRGSQVKHYHGLVGLPAAQGGIEDPGFEYETFTFLYVVTDNTMRKVEKSYLIVGAQIENAATSIYEYTKGTIEFKEITVSMHGFPLTSNAIDKKAQAYIDALHKSGNFIVNSADFDYSAGGPVPTKISSNSTSGLPVPSKTTSTFFK